MDRKNDRSRDGFSGRSNHYFQNKMIDRKLPAGNAAGELKSNDMKKLVVILVGLFLIGLGNPLELSAKPIWLKFKIGLFAKWSISFTGNCEDGWGLCFAFADGPASNANLGYDNETDKFYIKVLKSFNQSKEFSQGKYELKEDSPVDPKLITNFSNFKSQGKKVIIKKGIYSINDEGDSYLMAVDYYLQ